MGNAKNPRKARTCPLCGRTFAGTGNSPEPLARLADGPCCDECNYRVVIPARVRLLAGHAGATCAKTVTDDRTSGNN